MGDKTATIPAIVHLTAATHLTIKLTPSNFPVWRKHVLSTLTGLDLQHFIDGSSTPPTNTSADYAAWYRQDQILFSAILGSCTDAIQPLLASADTSREAWTRLNTTYANVSRSRIISLKSKLSTNPRGTRNIADYLREMRTIADDLALAQNPIKDEDLMIHIVNQLGDSFKPIVAAIKARDTTITYSELHDKLVDYETHLKQSEVALPEIITANYTYASRNGSTNPNRPNESYGPNSRPNHGSRNGPRNSRSQWSRSQNNHTGNRSYRANSYCQFCSLNGHDTKDCRKLARFLRDNNITTNTGPTINTTTTNANMVPPSWIFDTGASDHAVLNQSHVQTPREYGGPDEILLGDGTNLKITHIGDSKIPTLSRPLTLSRVLCVPTLQRNLVSVAKLCKTNKVSVEFFPSCFFCEGSNHGGASTSGSERQ
ncbi:putative RNA-directed DNA polymerase [Helianthus anomalus]